MFGMLRALSINRSSNPGMQVFVYIVVLCGWPIMVYH